MMDHPDAIRHAEERIATIQAALDEAQRALDDTRRVLQAAEKVTQDAPVIIALTAFVGVVTVAVVAALDRRRRSRTATSP
jgi:hypothetical protein